MNTTKRKRLEQQIQEAWERRGRQVQISTEVAQEIAAAPVLDNLFHRVVHLAQERFGYYHVQVYTLETLPAPGADQSQAWQSYLVMQAGAGEVGQMMKAAGHKIALSAEKSLVALAARTGKPVLTADVGQDPNWLANPLLPETRSEIAVPIKLGQTVLGVLDVQDDEVDGLSIEDQLLLLGLCGQIAIAIDYRRAEELLRASEAKLTEAQQLAHIGSWEWNIQTNALQWSDEVYRILGLDPQEFGAVDHEIFHRFVHPEENEMIQAVVDTALANKEPYNVDHRIVRPDGQVRIVHEQGKVVRNEKGQPVRMVGTVQDITEQKQAEEALKEYSERLEEMVAERTTALRSAQEQLLRQEKLAVLGQLAGGVAHELRNPLGVIANAVYFLNIVLAEADPVVIEYLDIIGSRVHEAETIVADLLNLSRVRPANREPVSLLELITEVLANHPPVEGIKVAVNLPPNLPPAFVDRQQIQQVLTNLVTNAYQAMPDGGELGFSAEVDQRQIRLLVSDTGCGMPPQVMTRIFEPLYTTKARGIGLGLPVSKNLVEINGGQIEVTSQENQGSTFTITLPIKEGTQTL
ncbi:MAG: PAS domain-containing protein [Anaerolineales bacterium]|nr:PAS domain-containing protein [Anaerolineales bacterium]